MQSPDKQNSPRVKLCVPSDIHCPLCKQAHIDSTYQALWAIIGPDNRSACWRCLRRHYPQIWRFLEWYGRSSCANDEEASALPRVGTSQDPKLVENLLAHRKKYGISFEPSARAYEIITDDAELVIAAQKERVDSSVDPDEDVGSVTDALLENLLQGIGEDARKHARGTQGDIPTGEQWLSFEEFSPHNDSEGFSERLGWSHKYSLCEEAFNVYVPETYDGREAYGLFLFIPAKAKMKCISTWKAVLSKHQLIWIAPQNAGNEREASVRIGLALDAVHNMQRLYNVGRHRVYVAGLSGGARCASALALGFPDVFSGAYCFVGCGFYRHVAMSQHRKKKWERIIHRPPDTLLEKAKTLSKFVLMTGENDPNRGAILDTYKGGFLHDGFRFTLLQDIPNHGHYVCNAKWLERGLEFLDGQIMSAAHDSTTTPLQLIFRGQESDFVIEVPSPELKQLLWEHVLLFLQLERDVWEGTSGWTQGGFLDDRRNDDDWVCDNPRHFLAGRLIERGDTLEWFHDGEWAPCKYERPFKTVPPKFSVGGKRGVRLPQDAVIRWPPV